MKKFTIISSLFISLLISDVMGQHVINIEDETKHQFESVEYHPNSEQFDRRNAASRWFTFFTAYQNLNGLTYRNIASVLFPDTSQILFTDGPGRVPYMTFGAVFSPNDNAFGNDRFNRWTNYTWDSLAWTQGYIRQVDSTNITTEVAASGTITVVDFNNLAGAILTIGSTTLTEGLEWDALTDDSATALSIEIAINAISGAPYTVSVEGNVITITNKIAGVSGNSVALSSSNPTDLAVSGSTLTGGGSETNTVEVVDTLFIQYFTGEGIDQRGVIFNDDPQTTYFTAYPRITGFTPSTLLNSAAFRTDTILQTSALKDSVTIGPPFNFSRRTLVTPVGRMITGGDNPLSTVIATAFTFKPMIPYTISDTVISFVSNTNISKKNNVMIFPYFNSEGHTQRISDNDALNGSFATTGDLKGGTEGIGRFVSYRSVSQAIQNMQYHLSTESTTIQTPSASSFRLGNAYPNPTAGGETFSIPFIMGNNGAATFIISDITGKRVKTITQNFTVGENEVQVSTRDMNSGIYFYQMVSGPFTGVGKVIVK